MGKRTNTAVWDGKRWKINVQKDGVRKSFYSGKAGRTGQREANAKADAWLDDGVESSKIKVEDAYAAFLELKKGMVGTEYYRNMCGTYCRYIEPVIGRKYVSTLHETDLQSVINTAYKKHGLAAKTLQGIRSELIAFCKYCRQRKLTTLLPESIVVPSGAKRSSKRILQQQDIITLFNSDTTLYRGKRVQDHYIHAYRLAVLTGIRPGELVGLKWENVKDGKLHIAGSVNILGERTQGKNKNSVRTIALSGLAKNELDEQRALTGGANSVFEIPREKTLYIRWKAYCAANGIDPISLYEMRHTFVSVAQSLPEGIVKKLVGHSKAMDTWGTYAHLLDGQQEDAANMVQDAFEKVLCQ